MFQVRKHCGNSTCTTWVIEWPDVEDKDGIPVLGLYWEKTGAIPLGFAKEEQAERMAAMLNDGLRSVAGGNLGVQN